MDKDGVSTMLISLQTSPEEALSSKGRLHLGAHEIAARLGIAEHAARGLVKAAQKTSHVSLRVSA